MSTGITPPGIPGSRQTSASTASSTRIEAKKRFDEWTAEGGTLTGPIKIEFNTGGSHEDVVAIIQANLKDNLGIDAELNPIAEDYFKVIAEPKAPARSAVRLVRRLPDVRQLHGRPVRQGVDRWQQPRAVRRPEFEDLIAEAQGETDDAKRGELYQQAEDYLLNDDDRRRSRSTGTPAIRCTATRS